MVRVRCVYCKGYYHEEYGCDDCCDLVKCDKCYKPYLYCECKNLYCTKHFIKECDECPFKHSFKYIFTDKKSAIKEFVDNRIEKKLK